ncbi:MAG: homoserine dehydrogenase, partial [Candidatus Altiarchaeota archaeon]|nr:homoserine dehydrogenase [Candidatus Altiarchaeota archaeon]
MKLIIVGFGNIGRGLVRSLIDNGAEVRRQGFDLKVVAVCEVKGCVVDVNGLDLRKLLDGPVEWGKAKTLDVISSVSADVVVELTPGNVESGEPGLSHMFAALNAKKHVVTSNKSPLAVAYARLVDEALKNGVSLKYEATVGGAIPIISCCEKELQGNRIRNIYGIMNGTTNYILTKMDEEGVDFKSALAEAQQLGYAETNSSYDISGLDTASKVLILGNALMDTKLSMKELSVSGIENISAEAMEVAKEYGYTIKLIGDVVRREVAPRLVPLDHPLNVGGSLNAILVETDLAGELTFIGYGAGPKQTSSALISDILTVAR